MFAREPGEMDEATCADCGKECEVPFKPKAVLPTARSVGRRGEALEEEQEEVYSSDHLFA